ncbi:GNAT family N-acetyltransferase [Nocardioides rubriscoriae]|uniref:GNAT family N-acetyltransferase n=1 Tax=Nocardioides rubriscoriae TaxID=642762 RepID=UPI0011E036C9|nr:GNAT family N-acetyltransferase [Nocardioides rubriscoriae]
MTYRLELTDDPTALLALAGEHLAADPVLATVVATVAVRAVGRPAPWHPQWWVSVLDGDRVVGVAMRTAPFRPYPLYVLPMPEPAALLVARAVVERDEAAPANGALPAARLVTEEVARLTGTRAVTARHTRLFELRRVLAPPRPPGQLRLARPEEVALCLDWYRAFDEAAAEQSGRPAEPGHAEHFDDAYVAERIDQGRIHLWEGPGGEVVHLTAANTPAYGVVRVGPVFTPAEHRGAGYASAAVAEVSQQVLDAGLRPCLFTDQDNPTSNGIYQALGYEPVVDMANHDLR